MGVTLSVAPDAGFEDASVEFGRTVEVTIADAAAAATTEAAIAIQNAGRFRIGALSFRSVIGSYHQASE
ncbi:hypothetical protein MN032_01495 [Agromyces atrinae]|uniref:hypothetical protein n=1 Tax=Agromyces atrinae TaxID=592376 RepID=UPI001F575AE3|nr:hypothetical protein [Agromyces atrinae]MCI2956351.1 hypothetical protein [Agromyces atrinae]